MDEKLRQYQDKQLVNIQHAINDKANRQSQLFEAFKAGYIARPYYSGGNADLNEAWKQSHISKDGE